MKNIEEIKKERTKPSRAEPREEKTKRIRQWRSDCLSLIAFLGGGDLFRVRGITVYAFPSPFDSYFTRFSDFSLSLSLSLSVYCFLRHLWFVRIWIFWSFFLFFFFWSAKFVTLLLSLSWNCVHSSEKLRYFKEIWILFFFWGVNNGIGRIQRKKLN